MERKALVFFNEIYYYLLQILVIRPLKASSRTSEDHHFRRQQHINSRSKQAAFVIKKRSLITILPKYSPQWCCQ
jgi:hypothetical protein